LYTKVITPLQAGDFPTYLAQLQQAVAKLLDIIRPIIAAKPDFADNPGLKELLEYLSSMPEKSSADTDPGLSDLTEKLSTKLQSDEEQDVEEAMSLLAQLLQFQLESLTHLRSALSPSATAGGPLDVLPKTSEPLFLGSGQYMKSGTKRIKRAMGAKGVNEYWENSETRDLVGKPALGKLIKNLGDSVTGKVDQLSYVKQEVYFATDRIENKAAQPDQPDERFGWEQHEKQLRYGVAHVGLPKNRKAGKMLAEDAPWEGGEEQP